MANHPWKGLGAVVRSRELFKFWRSPTISLERLIVSGDVNLVRRWRKCHKRLMVVGQLLTTPTVEICIQQLGRRLSAAAETLIEISLSKGENFSYRTCIAYLHLEFITIFGITMPRVPAKSCSFVSAILRLAILI